MAKNETAAAMLMKLEHARAKASKLLTLIDLATNEGGRVDGRTLEQFVRDAAAPARLTKIQIAAAGAHVQAVLGNLEIVALIIGGFTTNDMHEGLSGHGVAVPGEPLDQPFARLHDFASAIKAAAQLGEATAPAAPPQVAQLGQPWAGIVADAIEAAAPKPTALRTADRRLPAGAPAPVAGAEGPRTRVGPGSADTAAMDFGTSAPSSNSAAPLSGRGG